MKWKPTPIIKIYEALGSIGDKRYEIRGNTARVYSSSGQKYYEVEYDPAKKTISCNDNASYWAGYLGYPGIVFLLASGVVPYDPKLADWLQGFAWKDINQTFKNDFSKTQTFIDEKVVERYGVNLRSFHVKLEEIHQRINSLGLEKLASKKHPPKGY